MCISYFKIQNYKSLKNLYIEMDEVNVLIGANGSGKSNIISAIKFFYDNMTQKVTISENDIFDKNNKFSNEVRITVGYDIGRLKKRCYENLKKDNTKYGNFYDDVIKLSSRKICELTMIVIKNKEVVWTRPYNERRLLYNLYPFYLIDTRKVNLVDWRNLWFQIGDLGKLEEKRGKEFKEDIKKKLEDSGVTQIVYSKINKLFDEGNIKIKKYTPQQLATITAKLYFGGSQFELDNENLVYFSDGTNSFNYINIFINIVSLLTEIKIKEPIIIIDEPEIGLHHNYIDKIFECIFLNCKNVQFVLSTHSARLIKNILVRNNLHSFIFHIKTDGKYTLVEKMRLFNELRQCVRATDQHANAYFSQMLVCVEGVTEIELLQNPFLQLVYPKLNDIDIMQGMAEDVERKIISPSERKYSVPILYLIDMDKVITFEKKTKRFTLKKQFSYNNVDRYSYNQRGIIDKERNRIEAMVRKCSFRYKMPVFCSDDANLNQLKELIKRNYLRQDYFVMNTTIEGALINNSNVEMFRLFLRECKEIAEEKLNTIDNYTKDCHINEKTNIYRILFGGKCDLIMNIKELKKSNPNLTLNACELYNMIEGNLVKKTSGWVSRWLEFYICKKNDVLPFKYDSYTKVKHNLDADNGIIFRQQFKYNFQELDDLMMQIFGRY